MTDYDSKTMTNKKHLYLKILCQWYFRTASTSVQKSTCSSDCCVVDQVNMFTNE